MGGGTPGGQFLDFIGNLSLQILAVFRVSLQDCNFYDDRSDHISRVFLRFAQQNYFADFFANCGQKFPFIASEIE